MNKIRIGGKEYPCQMTMGALLRFKKETGREVTEVKGDSISDMITLLWCCVASACKRLNHPFDMSLMDMADSMDQDDFAEWQKTSFEAVPAPKSDKKKT